MSEEKRMLTVAECRDLSDEEIAEQMRLRLHMIDHVLVGRLYPSVLRDEIDELHDVIVARRRARG